jgi:hypothetical protein
LELQQECLDIRKTGIGHNGQPVLFYATRKSEPRKLQSGQVHKHEELAGVLKNMGLIVTPTKVKNALEALYPDKLAQPPVESNVIRDLFRYFGRRL